MTHWLIAEGLTKLREKYRRARLMPRYLLPHGVKGPSKPRHKLRWWQRLWPRRAR